MSTRVEVDDVSVNFGGIQAVRDVTLTVEPGTITGLIGPNGAGKTTLFNVITNLVPPSRGTVRMNGVETVGLSVGKLPGLGVARTFQTPRGFPSLTVRQNIEVMESDRRDTMLGAIFFPSRGSGSRKSDEILERVGLSDVADQDYSRLSGGQQRMLEIGRQLVQGASLLLLDEPTAGLDVAHQEQLQKLLIGLNDDGMTVLLVEHNLGFLLGTAQFVHVLDRGALIASADPDSVRNDPLVIEAYLGGGGQDGAEGA